jgi:protein TonB
MKSNHFIKKAEYPGGSEALKKFIKNSLRYPKEALMHRVEGSVFLKYEVNEAGRVHSISVINGLGYGCDNEAERIIRLLKYSQVKNRGVKVNTKFKLTIHFKLPGVEPIKINYIYTKKSN